MCEEEEVLELLESFERKVATNKISLIRIQNEFGIAKGTLSGIRNGLHMPSHQTFLKMKWFVEFDTPHPLVYMDKDTHFWCNGCNEILPNELGNVNNSSKYDNKKGYAREHVWECKACHNSRTAAHKRQNKELYLEYRRNYARRTFGPGSPRREEYLNKKRDRYYKRTYGEMWKCAQLVDQVSKEIKRK